MSDSLPIRRPLHVAVLSDLHLEMSTWAMPQLPSKLDAVIFAGDVDRGIARSVRRLAEERERGRLGPASVRVILVAGNHEHYGQEFHANLREGRAIAQLEDIDFLERDEIVIGDVRILGTTLWTDYAVMGDAQRTMRNVRLRMNDHRTIKVATPEGDALFTPEMARDDHFDSRDWIDRRLAVPHAGPTVVVTHHCPSRQSIHPRYLSPPDDLNGAFASDLDWLINRHQPDVWIHGHTHVSLDYRIGRTRVLCNPKGYGPLGLDQRDYENQDFRAKLLIKV